MRILACVLAVFCLAAVGCRSQPTAVASGARTATTGAGLAPAAGALDAEVAIPAGFPSDFPTYPRARLTAAAAFVSPGQVAYGMEWESLDATTTVSSQFPKRFDKSDWVLQVNSSPGAAFSATISRTSNPRLTGTFAIVNDVLVTRILVSLVIPD